jgi:hypothetical protein
MNNFEKRLDFLERVFSAKPKQEQLFDLSSLTAEEVSKSREIIRRYLKLGLCGLNEFDRDYINSIAMKTEI